MLVQRITIKQVIHLHLLKPRLKYSIIKNSINLILTEQYYCPYPTTECKNSIGDACTPQPREIIFDKCDTEEKKQYKDQEIFSAHSVSYVNIVKVQIMFD